MNNHAQSYQNYTSDSNVAQSSSSLPTSSVHYQQQCNQWPSYYDQSAQTSGGLAVAGSTASVTKVATVGSDYVHPSNQPPPPGTTSWKSDAGNTAAPPIQVRPEDVLEKALRMVETSERNYLYRCDQL